MCSLQNVFSIGILRRACFRRMGPSTTVLTNPNEYYNAQKPSPKKKKYDKKYGKCMKKKRILQCAKAKRKRNTYDNAQCAKALTEFLAGSHGPEKQFFNGSAKKPGTLEER